MEVACERPNVRMFELSKEKQGTNGSSLLLTCVIDNARLENRKSSNSPKNREDGSDFDDFRTKKIAATQAV